MTSGIFACSHVDRAGPQPVCEAFGHITKQFSIFSPERHSSQSQKWNRRVGLLKSRIEGPRVSYSGQRLFMSKAIQVKDRKMMDG